MDFVIFISITAITIIGILITNNKKNKNPEHQKEVDPEMMARMAKLRERKAQKKLERIAEEEQKQREREALEEKERLEYMRWKEEQKKYREAQKKALNNLGLISVESEDEEAENYVHYYGYNAFEYQADESLDIDKLLQYVSQYCKENESFKIWVNTSSGTTMHFSFGAEGDRCFAQIGGGPVKKFLSKNALRNFVWCFCQNEQLLETFKSMESIIPYGIDTAYNIESEETAIEAYLTDILKKSDYKALYEQNVIVLCENNIAIIEYELPSKDSFSWVKEYKYVATSNTVSATPMAETAVAKTYEQLLYSICLRSIYEVFVSKKKEEIKSLRRPFIRQFLELDLKNVDPKKCFKSLKGVSAAKLIDVSPVQPVLVFNKNDRRFIEGKDVEMNSGTNLASMDWEDFEHLVRELFEMEFSKNGGDVRVTQASRDGGVDAIVFDPDPLRGGKIVIQAKRYTNTVGVSAVRDLYGTVINEGANSGILITTSDYGHDSYEFAKDKPLKLLNGGHLLALLHKNGKEGYINIQEAKEINN